VGGVILESLAAIKDMEVYWATTLPTCNGIDAAVDHPAIRPAGFPIFFTPHTEASAALPSPALYVNES